MLNGDFDDKKQSQIKPNKANLNPSQSHFTHLETKLNPMDLRYRIFDLRAHGGAGSVPDGPPCRIRLHRIPARQGATLATLAGNPSAFEVAARRKACKKPSKSGRIQVN